MSQSNISAEKDVISLLVVSSFDGNLPRLNELPHSVATRGPDGRQWWMVHCVSPKQQDNHPNG